MLNKIKALLKNTASTFAKVEFTTKVKTAAAYKNVDVRKHTVANVQLFANVKAATAVFANAVKRSASKLGQDASAFKAQSNYFTHTACYSIVEHNIHNKFYLYCFFNSAKSTYTIDGAVATKAQVADLLTASAREKLLNGSKQTTNKTYNVTHEVVVRTIALENITSITTQKQTITP